MDKYNYQLNDTQCYQTQLRHAKWISMIDLKVRYHNTPSEHKSFYGSTFMMHRDKYSWLQMPMGLIQAPVHFQFIVESVLKVKLGNCTLPVVVYLDDIAVFGDR